jgi:hypothetical protein
MVGVTEAMRLAGVASKTMGMLNAWIWFRKVRSTAERQRWSAPGWRAATRAGFGAGAVAHEATSRAANNVPDLQN